MEDSKIILSIIVPVYNVERYVRKCVDSLLNQDIDNYEIILVDDGSTDNSPQICDEYAASSLSAAGTSPFSEADHFIIPIRVIHQQNSGLSAARNAGVKCANGTYLMFVDSDDYIEPNVLGGLMVQVERDNLDVLRYDFRNVNEQYEEFHPNKAPKRDVDLSESVVDGETFLNERLGPGCYVCHFILRRDLIIGEKTSNIKHYTSEKDSCLFTEGIYFEDVDWTPRMLLRANRVASTPKVVYNYLWRTGSITLPTDLEKRKNLLDDKIRLIRGFQEQSKFVKDSKWFKWMESSTAVGILSTVAEFPTDERDSYIAELRSMRVFPLMTEREKMWTHRLKMQLANISPKLYCIMMKFIHKGK